MSLILVYLIVFSGIGMAFLVLKHLKEVRIMSKGELIEKLKESKPLISDFQEYTFIPMINFWHDIFLPRLFREGERVISKFRILVLRVERKLLQLTNYIRGKRELKINGQNKSPYWEEIKKANEEKEE